MIYLLIGYFLIIPLMHSTLLELIIFEIGFVNTNVEVVQLNVLIFSN
jgi:hypothetical protein